MQSEDLLELWKGSKKITKEKFSRNKFQFSVWDLVLAWDFFYWDLCPPGSAASLWIAGRLSWSTGSGRDLQTWPADKI